MKFFIVFSILLIFFGGFVLFQIIQQDDDFHSYLDRSGPYVGTNVPRIDGIDGVGIKVAVIDTGVDFTHPDLLGYGPDGKVVGGYNFINEGQPPMDTNGHGTQVAGVIAADGQITGIAPKAKILAYKVSENGEGVSSELITRAINKAIEDGADIINISLGVNKTNSKIDRAVNNALEKEIFVVTAAGNDGPDLGSIGSPGRNFGSVTVGATYNNLTSSLVATLEVDGKPYTVIPMVGSTRLSEPITGKIIFGGYGKTEEIKELVVKDSILIVERGSDVEGELLYFSIKEKNAANAGAKALIVYNNQPGIFLGELIHEFMEKGYEPQIPVVSIDKEEGLEIKESINDVHNATIHLFYNPDFVAHFSSRGPVSPFYIKPEIVAPGAYINT
ncbi:MAG: S8 family serine peptidase, partial [Nitrosopumilus sp.]|nr:S8 family serine peptidase [Nitrosopumilus sp.]